MNTNANNTKKIPVPKDIRPLLCRFAYFIDLRNPKNPRKTQFTNPLDKTANGCLKNQPWEKR